ncbi:MAG: hypothetical protein CME21_08095 [Gemmatimonadetes bacterium]|nr:hypothetical protein [Gemmatimonadota bacterium]
MLEIQRPHKWTRIRIHIGSDRGTKGTGGEGEPAWSNRLVRGHVYRSENSSKTCSGKTTDDLLAG